MEGVYTIEINNENGEAFIGLTDIDNNIQIAHINEDCSEIMDGCILPIQGKPNSVLIKQNRFGILPFSIDISENNSTSNESFNFSINRINGEQLFDKNLFFGDKTEIEYDFESSEEQNQIEINDSVQEVQIWTNGDDGIRGIKFGSLPGLPYDEIVAPNRIIRLPKFSWSSSSLKTESILIVGRENGQIDKYVFNPSIVSARTENAFTINSSILANISPLRNNKIKSICVNESSPFAFISSNRGVSMVNVDTFKTVSFIRTSQNLNICIQKPKEVLWGVNTKEGDVCRILQKDYESDSSLSSESTVLLTTSSSFSSLSSSFSSSSTEEKTTSCQTDLSSSQSSSSLKLISGTHWSVGGDFYIIGYSAPQPTAYNSSNGAIWISYTITKGLVWISGDGTLSRQDWTISNIKIYSDSSKQNIIGGYNGSYTLTVWNNTYYTIAFNCGCGTITFRLGGILTLPGQFSSTSLAWWN